METFRDYSCPWSFRFTVTLPDHPLAHNQVTVAGTVLLVEAVFNRETRDSLSAAEQSYLHDSFKYTGGGLALTAIAARSLFKSGVAFRIMSANPCTAIRVGPLSRVQLTTTMIIM